MRLHLPLGGSYSLPRPGAPSPRSRKSFVVPLVLAPPPPPPHPPRAAATSDPQQHHQTDTGSAHPALAQAAIARGDPLILRSVVAEAAPLVDAVARAAALDQASALALLELGAVYLGERPSGPKGPLKWRRQKRGDRRRGKGATAAAATTTEDDDDDDDRSWWRRPVPAGVPIRVHASPKRFTAACEQVRVIAHDDDYVAICKPGGLPSMAHESNDAEHAAPCAEVALLRRKRPDDDDGDNQRPSPQPQLQLCHRLDTWTSGVLVLATNPLAAARFGEALKAPPLDEDDNDTATAPAFSEKTYLAITRGAPSTPDKQQTYPLTLVAWMYDGPWGDRVSAAGGLPLGARGPRLLAPQDPSSSDGRSWKKCELVIESAEVAPESVQLWAEAADRRAREEMAVAAAQAAEEGDDEDANNHQNQNQNQQPYHLLTIRLVTGRTHQIRAQLASVGCPIAGDSMYGPLVGVLADPAVGSVAAGEGLRAVRRASQAQLSGSIGLHAWRLRWRERGGTKVREYVARAPWEEDVEGGEGGGEDDDDDGAAGGGRRRSDGVNA